MKKVVIKEHIYAYQFFNLCSMSGEVLKKSNQRSLESVWPGAEHILAINHVLLSGIHIL